MSLLKETYLGLHANRRFTQIIVLLSFGLTFFLARLTTYLSPTMGVFIQGGELRVHHLVPGIFLSLIGGYLGISFWNVRKVRQLAAILFGIGTALTLDEFALWLNLKDVYWQREGRLSIDAVVITSVLFTLIFLISEAHDHKLHHRFYKYFKG